MSNCADLRERAKTIRCHGNRRGQIGVFRDSLERIKWLYLIFKYGIKTKPHFNGFFDPDLHSQLNWDPTRPNGPGWTKLVKIRVKEAMHMGFYIYHIVLLSILMQFRIVRSILNTEETRMSIVTLNFTLWTPHTLLWNAGGYSSNHNLKINEVEVCAHFWFDISYYILLMLNKSTKWAIMRIPIWACFNTLYMMTDEESRACIDVPMYWETHEWWSEKYVFGNSRN